VGDTSAAAIRSALQNAMHKGTGIIRKESALAQALSEVAKLISAFKEVNLHDTGNNNMELREVVELDGMLLAAHAVLLGAYFRGSQGVPTTGWTTRRETTRLGLSTP